MSVIVYSGIDYSHPEFEGRFIQEKHVDFSGGSRKSYTEHGTHVAGE